MEKIDIAEQLEYIEKVKKLNENKKLFYYILTMGCQLNENDSEKICGMLEKMGYIATDDIDKADLIIFNTCCVKCRRETIWQNGRSKKAKTAKRYYCCSWWLHDAGKTYS